MFDELFSGTNVEDAKAICEATVSGLSNYENSLFFVSTHIQQLELLNMENIDVFHLDCELMNGTPTFTYQVKKGESSLKIGQILFEQEGLFELLQANG